MNEQPNEQPMSEPEGKPMPTKPIRGMRGSHLVSGQHGDQRQAAQLSSAEIARMAGVGASAVSNWRRRENKNFPKPVSIRNGRPMFDYDAVAAWLKANGIHFTDQREEQRLMTFLTAWMGERDKPDSMVSALIWAICLRHVAQTGGMGERWKALAQAAATATDAGTTVLSDRCEELAKAVTGDDGLRWLALVTPDCPELLRHDDGKLAELIRFVDELDGPDSHAELVSSLLIRVNTRPGRSGGDHGFPQSRVSRLFADLAMSYWRQHLADAERLDVYDPACGIMQTELHLAEGLRKEAHGNGINHEALVPTLDLHCADVNSATASIAAQRVLLSPTPPAHATITVGDTLANDPCPGLLADLALVEPALAMKWKPDPSDPRWTHGVPSRLDSSLAWVEDAIAHLNGHGRAFVVTTGRPLFAGAAEKAIRKALVTDGCVEAIVALPSGLLLNTMVPTYVWVLSRPDRNRTGVAMIDISGDVEVPKENGEPPSYMAGTLRDFAQREPAVRNVRTVELLGSEDMNLTPAFWLAKIGRDPADIAREYGERRERMTRASGDVERALATAAAFDAAGLDATGTHMVRLADIADMHMGNVLSEWSDRTERRRSLPKDVLELANLRHGIHVARPSADRRDREADEASVADSDDFLTEPGDVVFGTVAPVSAAVDDLGGHRMARSLVAARLRDDRWIPEYVALMLRGAWNAAEARGSMLRRIVPRQLEVPALPVEQQRRIVDYALATEALERRAALMRGQLDTVVNAAGYGAAVGGDAGTVGV